MYKSIALNVLYSNLKFEVYKHSVAKYNEIFGFLDFILSITFFNLIQIKTNGSEMDLASNLE